MSATNPSVRVCVTNSKGGNLAHATELLAPYKKRSPIWLHILLSVAQSSDLRSEAVLHTASVCNEALSCRLLTQHKDLHSVVHLRSWFLPCRLLQAANIKQSQ